MEEFDQINSTFGKSCCRNLTARLDWLDAYMCKGDDIKQIAWVTALLWNRGWAGFEENLVVI